MQILNDVIPSSQPGQDLFKPDQVIEAEENKVQHIDANAYQIAMLNKMVPKAYKFDILEVV